MMINRMSSSTSCSSYGLPLMFDAERLQASYVGSTLGQQALSGTSAFESTSKSLLGIKELANLSTLNRKFLMLVLGT